MTTCLDLLSHGPEETQELGRLLGSHAAAGDLFLLAGGLGVGKTTLTQGIAWGLGVQEHARSPTFVLVTQYRGRLTLYHIDLYRLDDVQEVLDLGLDEYLFGDGVCVVEWAEKAPQVFPAAHLLVTLQPVDDTTRRLRLEARGSRYEGLLEAVRQARERGGR
ncbi:MAG: tRNA (adenosine(37)-N6)-threonylcarbamoyltransferase complex ATPase subunit type 1 TsaE [Chloroflexi bacterium]|nr:tRNA (adenosine(37)-N6)-threonylcarbamoyltransferase complex ATPase subunit type 1 TsaE [Chloroflexota bacterium]